MEASNKNQEIRFKHSTDNCQPVAQLRSETSGPLDDAITEGEDLAAQLAVALLMEEQRLFRKRAE